MTGVQTCALPIYKKTLTSSVSTAKNVESKLRTTQSNLDKEKKMLADSIAKKEAISKEISKLQVTLNSKKVDLINAETTKSTYSNKAQSANNVLSSKIDLYKSHKDVLNSTNSAIDSVNNSSDNIEKSRNLVDKFMSNSSESVLTRFTPEIVGFSIISIAGFFTLNAVRRNRRRGATQTDLVTTREPDEFDINLKARRTRVGTDKADVEFEEFLKNMRIRNAKLLEDIENEFTPLSNRTEKNKISKPKSVTKKVAIQKKTNTKKAASTKAKQTPAKKTKKAAAPKTKRKKA